MDNHEDYLDALTAYARSPGSEIPSVLDQYLTGVAKNGETLFQWPLLKPLIVGKIEQVIQELSQGLEAENIPTRPNVENVRFEVMHARIMDAVHKFTGAPFTIQRLCELLMDPKRHYKRSDKFMRGLEKNVLVVSTVDPFGRKVVSESSSNKPLVNGMDSSSSPFLPRDPHSSTPLPPVPDWVTSPSRSSHTAASSGADAHDSTQESSVTTNGVGNLVSSVYTDHGDQPLGVHAEEVIEETVVTMDTNEVASVTEEGGEAMAEEVEEMGGGEDTNASSSSSSSSSSEELSISDSSDSSTPSAPATSVTSSTEPQEDRPWACLTTQGNGTPDTQAATEQHSASSTLTQSEDMGWTETVQPNNTSITTSPQSDSDETVQTETTSSSSTTTLTWHPLTTTTTNTTSSTTSSSSSSSSSDVITSSAPSAPSKVQDTSTTQGASDPDDSFGFDAVTTSAASTESPTPLATAEGSVESSKSHIELEDSGGVNDVSDPSTTTTPAQGVETKTNQSGVLSEVGQVASSSTPTPMESSTTIISPTALPSPYPECDSVAGLERLVSSVDAASPITTVLSSSTSPPPPHDPLPHSAGLEDSADEPDAKRCRLSDVEDDPVTTAESVEESSVQEAISSSTSQEPMVEESEESESDLPSESTPVSQSEDGQVVEECNVPIADTTSSTEAQLDSVVEESREEEPIPETCELGAAGDKEAKQDSNTGAVGSPPSHLSSSSSSDSEGFDVSAGDGAAPKGGDKEEDTETTEAPASREDGDGAAEPMDQD